MATYRSEGLKIATYSNGEQFNLSSSSYVIHEGSGDTVTIKLNTNLQLSNVRWTNASGVSISPIEGEQAIRVSEPGTYKIEAIDSHGNTWNDEITIVLVKDGDDSYTAFLTNPYTGIPANAAGVVPKDTIIKTGVQVWLGRNQQEIHIGDTNLDRDKFEITYNPASAVATEPEITVKLKDDYDFAGQKTGTFYIRLNTTDNKMSTTLHWNWSIIKDGTGQKKINTWMRNYSQAEWDQYCTVGRSESWTYDEHDNEAGQEYDNSHITIGDTAYIVGTVSGTEKQVVIYGTVTAKDQPVNGVARKNIVMTTTYSLTSSVEKNLITVYCKAGYFISNNPQTIAPGRPILQEISKEHQCGLRQDGYIDTPGEVYDNSEKTPKTYWTENYDSVKWGEGTGHAYIFACQCEKVIKSDGSPIYKNWQEPYLYAAWNGVGLDTKDYAKFVIETNYFTSNTLSWIKNGDNKELWIDATYIKTGVLTVGQVFQASMNTGRVDFVGFSTSMVMDNNGNEFPALHTRDLNVQNIMDLRYPTAADLTNQILLVPHGMEFGHPNFYTYGDADGFLDWQFLLGANFGVTKNGQLYAKDANLSGAIHVSDGGTIGGWNVNSQGMKKSYLYKENGTQVKYEVMINGVLNPDDKRPEVSTCFEVQRNDIPIVYIRPTGQITSNNIPQENEFLDNLTIKDGTMTTTHGEYGPGTYGMQGVYSAVGINLMGDYTISNRSCLYIYNNEIIFSYGSVPYSGPSIYHNGSGTAQFKGTWVDNGGKAISSDRNEKHSIEYLDERYEVFFDSLCSRRFKYNSGTSNRYHTGFITQEIQSGLQDANILESEFAGIITFDNGTDAEILGQQTSSALRYHEFIALNTWQIQLLKPRMTAAEEKIAQLENEVSTLKQELENLKNPQNSDII